MIELGDFVKDRFTELKGTVIAKADYLYGCTQMAVVPRGLVDGKPMDEIWIDEPQLILIKKYEKPKELKKRPIHTIEKKHGGMRSHPHG